MQALNSYPGCRMSIATAMNSMLRDRNRHPIGKNINPMDRIRVRDYRIDDPGLQHGYVRRRIKDRAAMGRVVAGAMWM